jgi:putative sugar O-methyltransferase
MSKKGHSGKRMKYVALIFSTLMVVIHVTTQFVLGQIPSTCDSGSSLCSASDKFKEWQATQVLYHHLATTDNESLTQYYNHPYWLQSRNHIKKLIEGPVNENFLFDPVIGNAMVRHGRSAMQEYEILYLKNCLGDETKALLEKFKETEFGHITQEISEYNCSTNSLGHLYYAARLLESSHNQIKIKKIVEFGSGFGNLARVIKMIKPDVTLILIDFPELLALQHLYLSSTLTNPEIIAHTKAPTSLKMGAIHLIPVFLIKDLTIDADCFISTFALSESTEHLQKIIFEKKFFDASICYIAGQISGWGALNFLNQSILFNNLRTHYKDVVCEPFHSLSTNFILDFPSYEVMAKNPVDH